MLCGDIRTEMVEHEMCLLTSALSHIGRHLLLVPLNVI